MDETAEVSQDEKQTAKKARFSIPKTPREALFKAKRSILKYEQLEREAENTETPWIIQTDGLNSYETSFRDILEELSIDSLATFMEGRKRLGRSLRVIDLMASTYALRDIPHLDYGVAVSLVDRRNKDVRESDSLKYIEVIEGNLLEGQTWKKIRDGLGSSGSAVADVIMCRGVGGIDTIPTQFYAVMINRAWKLLTSDNGLLVTQVRMTAQIDAWVEKLDSVGVIARKGKATSTVGLVKNSALPDKLLAV